MTHFRRAEELWKKASKAREGSRRRTMGAAPTLEQRMAWRREQELDEEAAATAAAAAAAAAEGKGQEQDETAEQQPLRPPPSHRQQNALNDPPPRPPLVPQGTQQRAAAAAAPALAPAAAAASSLGRKEEEGGAGGGRGGEAAGGSEGVLDRATVRAKVSWSVDGLVPGGPSRVCACVCLPGAGWNAGTVLSAGEAGVVVAAGLLSRPWGLVVS